MSRPAASCVRARKRSHELLEPELLPLREPEPLPLRERELPPLRELELPPRLLEREEPPRDPRPPLLPPLREPERLDSPRRDELPPLDLDDDERLLLLEPPRELLAMLKLLEINRPCVIDASTRRRTDAPCPMS